MRNTLASLIAVFGLLVVPLTAQQQHRRWAADSAMFEQLGLTPDQRTKINGIREQVDRQNAPLREQSGRCSASSVISRPKSVIIPVKSTDPQANEGKRTRGTTAPFSPEQRARLKPVKSTARPPDP